MSVYKQYSKIQLISLIGLRVAIGWHFLYEGLYKLLRPSWTAKHFLQDADGWFDEFFAELASNPTTLAIVDGLNIWGLVLIGSGLIVGCLSRYAAIAGITLLAVFYVSHIPFIGAAYIMPFEGNYLWFDKNIVEVFALIVTIALPTSHIVGIDRFIRKQKNKAR